MFVEDLGKEFYSAIRHERLLIFVNNDVDAVCSLKILQTLLVADDVVFTVIPVTGKKDMYNEYNSHCEGYKRVLLINCGAVLDLFEFLEPRDDMIIFVADTHRPVEVTNIYNDGQIRLLHPPDPEEIIPEYDDIFRDSDSEESDSEDEFGEKRRRFDEATLLKKRSRREWEEKRHKILVTYSQYTYYGSSSAQLFYRLAWDMKRDCNDLLWPAVIGTTELLLSYKIEDDKYLMDTAQLQNHVVRLNADTEERSRGELKLSFERGLKLTLMRHWSLFEAIKHTSYMVMKFRLFSFKGERKLLDLLVDLGIPLIQCKQKYRFMETGIRNEVPKAFETKMEKYALDEIFFNTFVGQFGYYPKFSAGDMAQLLQACLEHGDASFDSKQAVFNALDLLSRSNGEKLGPATEAALDQTRLIVETAHNIVDSKQIMSAGPFLYHVIEEGTPNAAYLSRHSVIVRLAHFLLHGHISNSRLKKSSDLPFVLFAPISEAGLSVVVGIPPYNDKTRRNFFGKAFEQTVKNTKSRYLLDYWDSSLIQIKTEDRPNFLYELMVLLA